jgi:putative transcriptional regulator
MHALVERSMLPAEYLLDYASGAAEEPVALAIATHLDLSPFAAMQYSRLNAVGGVLLDRIEPTDMSSDALDRVLARIEAEAPEAALPVDLHPCPVPGPLQPYVGHSFDGLRWRSLAPGVEEYLLPVGVRGFRTSLLRIAAGRAMPEHTHAGEEITVVIEGAYDDSFGRFERGDIELATPDVRHKPIADINHGCICLAVMSAPVRLTGLLGWVVNPLLRV